MRDPGVLEPVAGGVALLLRFKDGIGFGVVVGDQGGDERPAILLTQLDPGNGLRAAEQVLHDGGAGGLRGKSSERAEPDDAKVVVGFVDHARGGECGALGEEFGLKRCADVVVDGGLGTREDRSGERFIALMGESSEGVVDVEDRIEFHLTNGIPKRSPEERAAEEVGYGGAGDGELIHDGVARFGIEGEEAVGVVVVIGEDERRARCAGAAHVDVHGSGPPIEFGAGCMAEPVRVHKQNLRGEGPDIGVSVFRPEDRSLGEVDCYGV